MRLQAEDRDRERGSTLASLRRRFKFTSLTLVGRHARATRLEAEGQKQEEGTLSSPDESYNSLVLHLRQRKLDVKGPAGRNFKKVDSDRRKRRWWTGR